MRFPLTALLCLLVLSACEPSPEAPPTEADAAVESPLADAPEETAQTAGIALDAEGLRLVDPATGSTRLLAFGSSFDAVDEALEAAYGAPDDTGRNEECGVGPLDYLTWGGLTVYAAESAFSGWFANEQGDAPATMAGIGPGSSRADLDAAYDVTVTEDTLGPEFQAGDLFGFLDDTAADGVVTGLWAGDNCFFR